MFSAEDAEKRRRISSKCRQWKLEEIVEIIGVFEGIWLEISAEGGVRGWDGVPASGGGQCVFL